jgi:hypothetical protein
VILSALLAACGPAEELGDRNGVEDADGAAPVGGKADGDSGLPEVEHEPYVEGSAELHYLKVDEARLSDVPGGSVPDESKLGLKGDAFSPTGRTDVADETLWVEGDLDTPEGRQRGWLGSEMLARAKTELETFGSRTIVVNLLDNRLYYLEGGELERHWNVGTGRNLGGNRTPSGRFHIEVKDVCPPYWGHSVQIPGCAAGNPLGPKALWFHGEYLYGLHGTTAPELLAEGTCAASRRVSGGCVRNVNSEIEWLFERAEVGDEVRVDYFDARMVFEVEGLTCQSPPNAADCRACIEGGGGVGCAPICPAGECRTCVENQGGLACLSRCGD